MKEYGDKSDLKLNFQKMKIMAFYMLGPATGTKNTNKVPAFVELIF